MYRLLHDGCILRLRDNSVFEVNSDCVSAIEFLQWCAEGNTPIPADPIQNTALRITMAQARIELAESDMLDAFDAYIASLPRADQIRWEYETFVERNNPLVVQVLNAKGVSDTDADAMFLRASKR